MNSSELKLNIFREIDSLEGSDINEFYGILSNFINGKKEFKVWNSLSEEQRTGIENALVQINSGKGIPHMEVLSKFRNKYKHKQNTFFCSKCSG
jgi:hypothetical protein